MTNYSQCSAGDKILTPTGQTTYVDRVVTNYIFTKNISLSLRARHYWITVDYDRFYDLQPDGSLVRNNYTEDHDLLVNAFNVDMVFRWIFAPASELLFVWKNIKGVRWGVVVSVASDLVAVLQDEIAYLARAPSNPSKHHVSVASR